MTILTYSSLLQLVLIGFLIFVSPFSWMDGFLFIVVPVFVNEILRPPTVDRVVSNIVEARTDMAAGGDTRNRAKAIMSIMERSTFEGRYTVNWRGSSTTSASSTPPSSAPQGWTLSGDLELTLIVPLPLFVPLPPGFNTIGSRIVKGTCQKRVETNLMEVRDAYIKWAKIVPTTTTTTTTPK
jgi:hypothetical protein